MTCVNFVVIPGFLRSSMFQGIWKAIEKVTTTTLLSWKLLAAARRILLFFFLPSPSSWRIPPVVLIMAPWRFGAQICWELWTLRGPKWFRFVFDPFRRHLLSGRMFEAHLQANLGQLASEQAVGRTPGTLVNIRCGGGLLPQKIPEVGFDRQPKHSVGTFKAAFFRKSSHPSHERPVNPQSQTVQAKTLAPKKLYKDKAKESQSKIEPRLETNPTKQKEIQRADEHFSFST